MKRSHLAREIIETVALALLIFLVVRFVIQSYHVEGPSMLDTLKSDQYVLVNKMAYLFQPAQRGDVIVFHNPRNTEQDYIKRVIGIPGDKIRVDATHVWVNEVELKEVYIKKASNPWSNQWTVPPNQYFVMGDNREISEDSRYWGFVPKDYIVGKAVLVYWPINAWKFVDTYSDVYKKIP